MFSAFALLFLAAAIGIDYAYRHRVIVQFGILEADPQFGDVVRIPTRQIAFRPNDSSYRFGLRFFKRSGRTFRARVVHILPSPPALGVAPDSGTLLPDGRFKIESAEFECLGGGVRCFRLSQGDPVGNYEAHLFVNGRLRKVVPYEVGGAAS
jgi:hypothetical protein